MGCQISTNCAEGMQSNHRKYKFSSRLLHSFSESSNNPENPSNLITKSDGNDFDNRLDHSIISYQQFLQANHDLKYPFDGLGNIEDQIGYFQGRVQAWYEQSRQNGLINGNPYDSLSLCYSLKKDVSLGRKWYEEMIDLHPTNQYLHFGLGNIYYKLEMYDQAEMCYRKAIEIHPRMDKAYQNIANIFCFKKFDNPQAEEWARFALKINPKNYYASLINALVNDNISHQIHLLQKLLESCPNYARVHNALGHAYLQKRKYNTAIKYLLDGYGINDSYFAIPCGLALAYNKVGKFEEAIKWGKKAVDLNPFHHQPYHCLGDTHTGKGELEEAKQWYLKSIEVQPNFNQTYLKLARLQSAKNHQQSIRYFQIYLSKDEDSPDVLYELAQIHLKRQQIQLGVDYLLAMSTLQTEQQALFLLAQSLLRLKKYDQSELFFSKYINSCNNSQEATKRVQKSRNKFGRNRDKMSDGEGEK